MQYYYDMVETILERDKRARDDDGYLYTRILKAIKPEALSMSVEEYFIKRNDIPALPNYDTVTRMRRKVQEECPWLAASQKVRTYRTDNEQKYRDFMRNEVR